MVRFGVQLPGSGAPAGQLFERVASMASATEGAGFDSVWADDHSAPVSGPGAGGGPVLESYTLLGALAARTGRVTLGALVSGVTVRNPGLLAKMVTTLDVISGGRAVLGLGVDRNEDRHAVPGIEHPGHRGLATTEDLDLLEEAVQVCRALFTGDDVTFEGTHVQLDHARNLPRPVRVGGPQILVGSGGGWPTLRLAARYADRCSVTGDAATLARTIGDLRLLCAEVGRDPSEVGVTWTGPLLVTDSDQQTRELRRLLGSGGSGENDGCIVGRLGEVPGLVAGLVEAGAEELVFALPVGSDEAIAGLGRVLGTSG
jgi:alkanesulfonate monooxygenase SsuD/methylene tetrahydromethanopterin reductase-like flavin-dependent oxidoreductase (luciferase family)